MLRCMLAEVPLVESSSRSRVELELQVEEVRHFIVALMTGLTARCRGYYQVCERTKLVANYEGCHKGA